MRYCEADAEAVHSKAHARTAAVARTTRKGDLVFHGVTSALSVGPSFGCGRRFIAPLDRSIATGRAGTIGAICRAADLSCARPLDATGRESVATLRRQRWPMQCHFVMDRAPRSATLALRWKPHTFHGPLATACIVISSMAPPNALTFESDAKLNSGPACWKPSSSRAARSSRGGIADLEHSHWNPQRSSRSGNWAGRKLVDLYAPECEPGWPRTLRRQASSYGLEARGPRRGDSGEGL